MKSNTSIATITIILVIIATLWGMYYFRAPEEISLVPNEPSTTRYTNNTLGLSIVVPNNYIRNESYEYLMPADNKTLEGVAFRVPTSLATGTNLSNDSYLSIEQALSTSTTGTCSPYLFLDSNGASVVSTTTSGNTTFSHASLTGAGAGNRYEEHVYTLRTSSTTCAAIRYFIHYSVFENYPVGTVREFDKSQLLSDFDSMRASLIALP